MDLRSRNLSIRALRSLTSPVVRLRRLRITFGMCAYSTTLRCFTSSQPDLFVFKRFPILGNENMRRETEARIYFRTDAVNGERLYS